MGNFYIPSAIKEFEDLITFNGEKSDNLFGHCVLGNKRNSRRVQESFSKSNSPSSAPTKHSQMSIILNAEDLFSELFEVSWGSNL